MTSYLEWYLENCCPIEGSIKCTKNDSTLGYYIEANQWNTETYWFVKTTLEECL